MDDNARGSAGMGLPGKILSGVTFCLDWVYRILQEYSKLVLLLIVIIVSAQVFSRKVLHTSIRWSEEVALLLMIWMAFISMAIGVEKKLHISITVFFGKLPKVMQKVLEKLNTAITFAFGLAAGGLRSTPHPKHHEFHPARHPMAGGHLLFDDAGGRTFYHVFYPSFLLGTGAVPA